MKEKFDNRVFSPDRYIDHSSFANDKRMFYPRNSKFSSSFTEINI